MFNLHSPLRRAITTLSVVALGTTALIGLNSSAGATVSPPSHWLAITTGVNGPSARYDGAMAYDAATKTTVFFGGFNGSDLAETWTWNGSLWTKLTPSVSPPALRGAAMTFDAATNTIVLFGGSSAAGLVGDTWSFDGTNWTRLAAAGPSPREGASMTYDAATRSVILFGGQGANGPLGDTWTWNGSSWATPTLSEPAPAARYEQSMAYDEATHSVILFGGMGTSGPLGDTWTFDGVNWTRELAANPPARYGASMFYDPTTSSAVLFGGSDATATLADTWQWSGSSWSTVLTASAPSARRLASVAYDAATSGAVLFGGDTGANAVADTWNFVDLPTAPLKVHATSNNNTQSVVSWNVPASSGGTIIYAYSVAATDLTLASRGGQTCSTATTTVTISSSTPVPTTCTLTGLTNGDLYRFAVVAMSLVGTGAASWSNVVRPATAPSAPTITNVTASGGVATVYWSTPVDTGGTPVGSYRVIAAPGGAFCHVPFRMLSCRIPNLVSGTTYTFTMTATNAAGTSATSATSVPVTISSLGVPVGRHVTRPSAPIIVRKIVSGRYVTIRWVAPISNGGVRLSGYNIYVGPTSYGAAYRPMIPVTFRQFAYTFELAKGQTVYVVVRAVNTAGIGPFSNQVAVTAR